MYVTNFFDGTVTVIDTTTNTVESHIPVGNGTYGIEYDPVNKRMYVTNFFNGTVTVIDTTTNTVIGSPINVIDKSSRIEYDPVNKKMYVASLFESTVSVINVR